MSGRTEPATDAVAATAERLAVLIGAGVPPAAAWRHLAEAEAETDPGSPQRGTAGPVVAAARAATAGEGTAAALLRGAGGLPAETQDAWAALAAAWHVAELAGAPPAACLRCLAGSLRELGRVQRQIAVALAAPRATARMVMAMPVIAVLFGLALGFDTLRILATTVPGLACAAAAGLLMLAATAWNRRLVRRASPPERAPGLSLDMLAVAMTGGVSVVRARELTAQSLPARLAASRAELAAADDVLGLAERAGVPAAELLRSEAAARRSRAATEAERRAVALSVRLMAPLGVCVLPAFMLVGVVPLLLSIVSSTVAGFG